MKPTTRQGPLSLRRKILYICRQFGVDPVRFFTSVRNFPWYLRSLLRFYKMSESGSIIKLPTLADRESQSGSADGHYFWQDLICARWIYERKTLEHFDVGSRVDGFIAHLLSFMDVTVLDVRPLETKIPGLHVLLGNAQKEIVGVTGKFQSVSSLHSIEHFGLGRYGDDLDFFGHQHGLVSISKCVAPYGLLYVSFPIGQESVEFNSQRIIDPLWPVTNLPDFTLEEFVLIPWRGSPLFGILPEEVDRSVWGQAGLYRFRSNL